jgi:hypothetical protein
VAFQKSKHYELLRAGDNDAPSCSTCHGNVAAELLSPIRLANECKKCHGDGKVAYRVEHPILGKVLLERVREVRKLLNHTEHLIHRIKDKARRGRLEEAYRQAEVPLIEAVNSAHSFVFIEMQERLGLALKRAEALLEELANPKGSR